MPTEAETHQLLLLENSSADWHQLAWVLALILVVVLSWRLYGLRPPGWRGMLLRSLRALTAALLISLLAAPAVQHLTRLRHPAAISIAIDQSASMARADHRETPRIAAAERLRKALATQADERTNDRYWAIGDGVHPVDPDTAWTTAQASAPRSNLGNDLRQVAGQRRADLSILVSDGRHSDGPGLAEIAPLIAAQGSPWYVLATGSETIDADLTIDAILAPRTIARGERQPIRVQWHHRALPAGTGALRILTGDGSPLAETDLSVPTAEPETLVEHSNELLLAIDEPGEHDLTVLLTAGEESRRRQLRIAVQDRRLRILLLAQRPRWELRYLRSALDRDPTVTVHSFLYPQSWQRWGDDRFGPPSLRLDPATARDYDAILIGDLPATALSPSQQAAIESAVRQQGCGLLWLAGSRGHLADFDSNGLGALLPVRLPDAASLARGFQDPHPFHPQRSREAERLGLLEPLQAAWSELPALSGRAVISAIRAGATTLLHDGLEQPLVVARPFGRGRSVFIAIDDTWRWRRDSGDAHLHRFHSPLLRWASAGRLSADQDWQINVSPFRIHPGQALRLSLSPNGSLDPGALIPERVNLRLRSGSQEYIVATERLAGDTPLFIAEQRAPGLGDWQVTIADGLPSDEVQPAHFSSTTPDAERRDPRRDRAALAALAQATGGALFERAEDLIAALPDLRREEVIRRQSRLWDHAILLLLTITVLSLEWSLRRLWRLP